MSAKGLEVIDHTVQETHMWINETRDRLGWTEHRDAMRFLRVVLRTLRDQLPHDEMAQFSAQLPLLIRGMFFEAWQPHRTPVKDNSAEGFIAAVETDVGQVAEYRGTEDITTVLSVLQNRISEGEIADVLANLSPDIRALWPAMDMQQKQSGLV